MSTPAARLQGGPLNAAIANEVSRLWASFTGRGASASRAFLHHDVVVCLLEGALGRTETSLIAAGRSDLVREQRDAIQRALEPQLMRTIEGLTGTRVLRVMSGSTTSGSDLVEVFVLEHDPAHSAEITPDA